jgi:hypothetical protein
VRQFPRQDVDDRPPARGTRRQHLRKHRALADAKAHEDADNDERGAGEERYPPCPRGELIRRDRDRRQQENEVREDDSRRQSQRDEAAEEPPAVLRRVFNRHQHRAAPLAAERKSLHEAEDDEQRRRPQADLRVARQQPDGDGGGTHQRQRPHQHRLAADAIPEMPHDDAPERTSDEADGKRREGGEHGGERGRLREELRPEDHRRGCPVNEEVVPLDRRADRARHCHAPRLRRGGTHDGRRGAAGHRTVFSTIGRAAVQMCPRESRVNRSTARRLCG